MAVAGFIGAERGEARGVSEDTGVLEWADFSELCLSRHGHDD